MKYLSLTDYQKSVLNGCMLGDGHLTHIKTCKSSEFRYISSSFEHCNLIYNVFKNIAQKRYENGPIKNIVYDKRTNKNYTSYHFRTKGNKLFYDIRQLWYPDGIKIIPEEVINNLNNIVCLFWFIGDGSLLSSARSQTIKISTNNFTKNDVDKLTIKLCDFNARCRLHTKDQPIIFIPKVKIKKFLNFIGDCPVKDYSHKWNYINYKNKKFENKTQFNTQNIKSFLYQDFINGCDLWQLHKKYKMEYNLIKYHYKKWKEKS